MTRTLLALGLLAALVAAEPPRALVLEHADRRTKALGAAQQLEAVGYTVQPLLLDRAPAAGSAEIIVIGSFATDRTEVRAYLKRHAEAIRAFMRAGGVVLQLTQADQDEPEPAFLPKGTSAVRTDHDCTRIYVTAPDHPLLKGLDGAELLEIPKHLGGLPSWETFEHWRGLKVLLAHDRGPRRPVLLEGAVGKGRLLLTSLVLDKGRRPNGERVGGKDWTLIADTFFRNVRAYADLVAAGKAPAVEPTPAHDEHKAWAYTPGAATVAVLPPTNGYYGASERALFAAQTQWLVRNARTLDLRFVFHTGNIVYEDTRRAWDAAAGLLSPLKGRVPYALATGPLDIGMRRPASSRASHFSRYFGAPESDEFDTVYPAEPARLENSCWTFTIGKQRWVALVLEFGPRKGVVEWANERLARHKDRRAIIVTHAFLYGDGRLYDMRTHGEAQRHNPHHFEIGRAPGGVHDGAELWSALVSRHANIRLVLCASTHQGQIARRRWRGRHGNDVHVMVANYWTYHTSGKGLLRLLEFQPDGKTLRVKTYSPAQDLWLTDAENQFALTMK